MPGSGWGGSGVGAITAGDNITISPSGGTGTVTINAVPSGASGSIQFATSGSFASDNANLFWDDTNNRLGVGIAAPLEMFHLFSTASSGAKVLIDTTDLDKNIALGFKGPSAEWQIGSNRVGLAGSNDNLYFRHSNTSTNVIVCEPGGNIGIGLNNPSEMLHVMGNIRCTGGVTLAGNLFLDGGSNTFINEASADTIGFTTGATSRMTLSTSTLDTAVDINTQAGKVYKQSGNSGTGGNGTTFTFGGGGSGDIASLTIAGGIVTGTTTVP